MMTPAVLGPDRVPVITDPAEASRVPELAMLSALSHGGGSERENVLKAFLVALGEVDPDFGVLYYDLVFDALPMAARRDLEELMATGTYEYQSGFARRYFSQGEAKGEAMGEARGRSADVLTVLDVRGVAVPDDVRARILACTDQQVLGTWLRRAVTADSIDDIFTD
jgi:hypothetical protein